MKAWLTIASGHDLLVPCVGELLHAFGAGERFEDRRIWLTPPGCTPAVLGDALMIHRKACTLRSAL